MSKCIFDRSWIGPCNKETTDGDYCEEHASWKCCSCGAKATRDCEHTGQLVCGAPLCDECTHHPPGPDDDNFMFMGGGHAKKSVAEPAWQKHWEEFYAAIAKAKGEPAP